jgi:SAM-dependent methyltransferase
MTDASRLGASVADDYESLARDYDWLLTDDLREGAAVFETFGRVIERLGEGARVLDCACGTGWNAIALRRAGFETVATDASPAMIGRARENAAAAGVDIDFGIVRWHDLARRLRGRFDAIACVGNSIVHAGDGNELVAALGAMRELLEDHGHLLLDSRDWETGWGPGRRVEAPPRFHERDGMRCLPIRVWETPADFADTHHVDFVFVFEEEAPIPVTVRSHRLAFRPFRIDEIEEALTSAGLTPVDVTRRRGFVAIVAGHARRR